MIYNYCVSNNNRAYTGQVKAGAQLVQVFESHAGLLDPEQFSKFCLPYLETIDRTLKRRLQEKDG